MRINVMSIMLDDQTKALRFYTEVLGFVKKREIPLGEHSWLTVSTRPRGRSSRHSSKTESRSRRSPSTMSRPSTTASSRMACASPNHRRRWAL